MLVYEECQTTNQSPTDETAEDDALPIRPVTKQSYRMTRQRLLFAVHMMRSCLKEPGPPEGRSKVALPKLEADFAHTLQLFERISAEPPTG